MNKDENKVFVITSGEYSDYHIERVFSTHKKAQEYLDTKDDGYRLEEYYLDEPIERQTQVFRICFELDEKKVRRVGTKYGKRYKDLIQVYKDWRGDGSLLDIYVESDSKKRALKVASERYGLSLPENRLCSRIYASAWSDITMKQGQPTSTSTRANWCCLTMRSCPSSCPTSSR